jgi:hypothetical protein
MKKLGKLTINPEKVIKNDELVNLRGGYEIEGGPYYVSCKVAGNTCGGFWEEVCPGSNIMWKCHRVSSCASADSYVCV